MNTKQQLELFWIIDKLHYSCEHCPYTDPCERNREYGVCNLGDAALALLDWDRRRSRRKRGHKLEPAQ